MSSFERPTYSRGRERDRGEHGRRRAPDPRWEDDDRYSRTSSEREPHFGGYEGEAERAPFEPREDFPRSFREHGREHDFARSFGERDPGAWRRGGGHFEQDRSGRFASESREGSGPGRGFERFEDWQQPRFAPGAGVYGASGVGVYGGTPQRDAELRGAYPNERRGRGGPYAGRGPKDFRRSDERLREEICENLMADPEIDATELTVSVRDGEVTLEGSVEDRQMKRDAEDCAEGVLGVRQVHNRLRVESGAFGAAGSRPFEAGSAQRGQQAASPEGQRASRSPGKPV